MAAEKLSTKAIGSIVKLTESGKLVDFIVVHQGKPSSIYDDSCQGTWLLRSDLHSNRVWDGTSSSYNNKYEESDIDAWLNGEYLNSLDPKIKAAILQAKIPYRSGGGSGGQDRTGASGLSRKVFLLSGYEVGFTTATNQYFPVDGALLSYFLAGDDTNARNKRIAKLNNSATFWWLRSPYTNYTGSAWFVGDSGGCDGSRTCNTYGIRPALILPSDLLVSDDGSVSTNTAPTAPGSITIPDTIQGGQTITVSWTAATDTDGNLSGYELERQHDGDGQWAKIYDGSLLTYTDTIEKGWASVQYRVRAYDTYKAYSVYATSELRTVNNNTPPKITCDQEDGKDLGEKTDGFIISYSTSDEDGDSVTVKEAIDGVQKRSFTSEGSCQFEVTDEYFQKLLNGKRTMTIEASDGKAKTVHTLTFTKKVNELSVTMKEPMEADALITICVLSVIGNIPADAEYKVEVTNNAKDDEPAWEDCTAAVKTGANHIFENSTADKGNYFNFRITAKRGEGGQGGYINSVQGGFQ